MVTFTPWSVDRVDDWDIAADGKTTVAGGSRFYAWRFKDGRRERHESRASFAEALADCDELNRIARESPEWKNREGAP